MSIELLKKSLRESSVIMKGNYPYVINPLTDGIPFIEPELLCEVTAEMKKRIEKLGSIDKIVTIEAMGIPLATSLSLEMNIPFIIIRKRKYELPDEVEIDQKTGYSKSKLYINGLKKGDRVIIVDDIISTGGTLQSILTVLQKIGVDVKGVITLVDKSENKDYINKKLNVNIESLIKLKFVNNKVLIV